MQITKPESVGLSSERLARIRPGMSRYLDEGKYAGMITLVARRGKVAHFETHGQMNLATGQPMAPDAIFRIYSMTKPVTSVAALMLLEEGRLRLADPVGAYLPALKKLTVLRAVTDGVAELEDQQREITIHDLFTHSAGLSYGFDQQDYLDQRYQGIWKKMEKPEYTLDALVADLSELPLRFQPGTRFHYSFAIDVLGRIVELISGQRLDAFFRARIFEPLGMEDTAYWLPPEKASRLAANYTPDEKNPGALLDMDPQESSLYLRPVSFLPGGHGLVSTAGDYLRFCQMLLNGGALDGERLLGRKTVELMRRNHLPAGVYEDVYQAYGFGLGGNVLVHPERAPAMGSAGSWGWGGAANTKFWIDFEEELIALLMLQFMPSDLYPVAVDYQNLVYQALVAEA